MFKRILLAAAAAAVFAGPANAALVRLNFSGEIDEYNSYFQSGHADATYTAAQNAYIGGINRRQGMTPGSLYNFTIQYDSDAVAVGGRYDFDLVSGSIGPHTDFSGFTRFAIFRQEGAYTYLNFVLEKTTGSGGTAPIYAIFNLGDNDGTIQDGVLPAVVDPAQVDFKNASFEARGGFVSAQYRSYFDSASVGVLRAAPIGGVPEPGAWALMIAGFGLAGTALRGSRRRINDGVRSAAG